MDNHDFLNRKAKLGSDQRLGFIVGHFVGVTVGTITESRQSLVVSLAHVGAGSLAGLPLQLLVQLGLEVSDPLLVHLAVLFAGPVHLQDFAVQPVDLGGPGLVDFLLTASFDEGPAEGVLVAVKVIVGLLDLGVLEGKGLEPGALDKLGHHHFCVPP